MMGFLLFSFSSLVSLTRTVINTAPLSYTIIDKNNTPFSISRCWIYYLNLTNTPASGMSDDSLLSGIPRLSFDSTLLSSPQWGAADAEIKVPSGENTELKRSPFKAWSRSVYSRTCYACCQGFLSFLLICTLPVHLPAFFPKPLPIFSCVGCG